MNESLSRNKQSIVSDENRRLECSFTAHQGMSDHVVKKNFKEDLPPKT